MDFTTKEIAHKIAAAACDKKARQSTRLQRIFCC